MKFFYILLLLFPLAISSKTSCKKPSATNCFKGKLAIKGICANYVISIVEGNPDTAMVVPRWQDPVTGTVITNAFKLNNPCSFPGQIKEGEEFYFSFTDIADKECVVCMAYRPVPDKKNMIVVSPAPCK